jgi:hypothetical protein
MLQGASSISAARTELEASADQRFAPRHVDEHSKNDDLFKADTQAKVA